MAFCDVKKGRSKKMQCKEDEEKSKGARTTGNRKRQELRDVSTHTHALSGFGLKSVSV